MAYQEIVSTGSIYKGRTSMWLYLFHRVTGVALFGYLLLHIISTALILAGPEIYEGAEAIYKNFYFRLGEVGLMAAVLAHAINGLRIITVDLWKKGSDYQKSLNAVALLIFIGIFIVLAASRLIPHPPNFTSLLALSFYIPAILGIKFID